jgi:hypothetical protein
VAVHRTGCAPGRIEVAGSRACAVVDFAKELSEDKLMQHASVHKHTYTHTLAHLRARCTTISASDVRHATVCACVDAWAARDRIEPDHVMAGSAPVLLRSCLKNQVHNI